MALLAAVLAMVVLGLLGAAFASLVVQHQLAGVNEARSGQALYVAQAGFELAMQELLDDADKAFNGAAADGVIGGITNVPIGAGKVSVSKGTQTPPVFTATGTVGDVSRVLVMTVDEKNMVTNDPVFNDAANLGTYWPETLTQTQGDSQIASVANSCCSPTALRIRTTAGSAGLIDGYREQTFTQAIPAKSFVTVRWNYMRDRDAPAGNVDKHQIELLLVTSSGTTSSVWSSGVAAVSDADKGVWKTGEVRGFATSTTNTTTKVRLGYLFDDDGGGPTTRIYGWFDNIQVLLVTKSSWTEP